MTILSSLPERREKFSLFQNEITALYVILELANDDSVLKIHLLHFQVH